MIPLHFYFKCMNELLFMKIRGKGFLSFLMFLSYLIDSVFLKKFLIIFLYPKCNIGFLKYSTI
ncbi:hypothetical protein A9237_23120 [Vibrio owensii]|nr:hypothetical protein A9237_23120 [Vibrio owensii]